MGGVFRRKHGALTAPGTPYFMRIAFLVLVIANLAFLFWGRSHQEEREAVREPDRLVRQIQPDQIRIRHDAAPAAGNPAPPHQESTACKRIEGLNAAEAEAIKTASAAALRWESATSPQKDIPAHWIAIVDLPSRPVADKKRAELRQLGVQESQVVEDSRNGPFAVSLGLFRDEKLAGEFLQVLVSKGVRSARMLRRELPSGKLALELRAPAGELAAKLPELLRLLPHATVTECL